MRIEHDYTGTREQAYEKVSTLLTSLQEQYKDKIRNPTASWNNNKDRMDFSFEVHGFTLSGVVKIEDGRVVLDGKVPFLARMAFGEDKAEDLIRKKLEEIL
jgi:hypothetical protein